MLQSSCRRSVAGEPGDALEKEEERDGAAIDGIVIEVLHRAGTHPFGRAIQISRSKPACSLCGDSGFAIASLRHSHRLAGFRPLGGAYGLQETIDFQLEAIAFAGQGLRRRKHLRGCRTRFIGALVHFADVAGNFAG